MKIKILLILLSALLVLSISGCNNPPLSNTETTEKDTTAEQVTENDTTSKEELTSLKDGEATTPAECETTMPAEVETTTR